MILGIDCGGTKTHAVLMDSRGEILGEGFGGPSNPNASPMEVVMNSIKEAVLNAVGNVRRPIRVVCVSAAGTLGGNIGVLVDFLKRLFPDSRVLVKRDYEIAHVACFLFGPGVVFIAGTGSIAYGINEAGKSVRVGGWGHLLGDEGSGYWVGRKGLTAALRAYDGRGRNTRLVDYLVEYFGVDSPDGIIGKVYSSRNPKTLIGGFAPYVVKAAIKGDGVAMGILTNAVDEIVLAYRVAVNKLGFSNVRDKLAITGGFYAGSRDFLRPLLIRRLEREFGERIELREPAMSEAEAAALFGLRHLRRDV